MEKRLILSTDEVNRFGFRVLSAGARLESYKNNPVLLFDHSWGHLPIGRLEDIRVEEGRITALPVFDETDPFGLACKQKWEGGFLFAASIYFDPVSTSSDPALLLPGQSGETVTEWNLLETSMVTIPANGGAAVGLALNYRSTTAITKIKSSMELSKIAQALSLAPDVTQDVIVLAIDKMSSDIKALSAERVHTLIAQGRENGIVTDNNETAWRALAAADFANAQSALSAKQTATPQSATPVTPAAPAKPAQTVLGMIHGGTPGAQPDPKDAWTFDDWSKKDPKGLSAMRKDDNDRYQKLAMAKYEAVN